MMTISLSGRSLSLIGVQHQSIKSKTMRLLLIISAVVSSFVSPAQESNPFYVGHSLVNHNMPYMVQSLAVAAGKQTHYGRQIINGSPLENNFNNPNGAEGTPYTTAFPNGNYNRLVVTEAVPLQNHLTWSNAYVAANNFYNYAKNNNNGVPVKFYIYETWHCINSGIPNTNPNFPNGCWYDNTANSTIQWHPRLQADFSLWSGIVTHVRNQNPGDNQIWMVPAGQAFYNLTIQINAGNVPGISSFRDLFSDDIHLTNAGNYFVACVMYATIYGESPVGLTSAISNQWGNPYTNMPTPAQAAVMQQVAWSTVTGLSSWTGVTLSTLPVSYSKPLQAKQAQRTIHLSWSVSNQTANDKYIIEHSQNAKDFLPVGEIKGDGNHTAVRDYEYTHQTPSTGINYYRIKQVDFDGKYSFSNVARVQFKGDGEGLSLYPNPSPGHITVVVPGPHKNRNIQIYNSIGLLIKEASIDGSNRINVSDLPQGVYYIRLKDSASGTQAFFKL